MKKPTVISLFSGAGGLDYGFEAAGFETRVAVEMNADACATLAANRPDWRVIQSDIMAVSSESILEAANLKRGQATVLIGGPPCQPFSKAGYWAKGDAKRLDDPRANTLGAYLRVLEDTLPAAFLLENVEGLAFREKDEGLHLLFDTFAKINKRQRVQYQPTLLSVNAADFGVPQLRKRIIIVGLRDGTKFEPPPRTHGHDLEPYRTAWDALHDLAPPTEDLAVRGKWAALLPSIPEGHNYLWHTDRMGGQPLFGWRRRYWSFLLKLAKNQPSWTIQAQPGPAIGPFHWLNRRLSVSELARLQTFPDGLTFVGGRVSVQRQLGNAVPSLLAEIIARTIRQQFSARLDTPLQLAIARAGEQPAPEKPQLVPRRFLALRGRHQPHKGTGLGPGARRRAVTS